MATDLINPNTGKTDTQVLNESNAVAERAAKMLGGSWKQGYKKADGSIGGGYTPQKIVSSNSVINTKNQNDAVLQGGNALVTDGGSNLGQQYMNLNYQNQDASIAGQQDLMQSMQLVFDSQLARTNHHYNNLMQDLQQNFQKQSQLATQQAAALNPYSEAQGAMTAKNFQGAISNEYNKQSARLQEAATLAQNELAAGKAQAYVQISNAMKESNRNFQKGMMEYVMGLQAAEQQQQNWQSDFGLKTAGFGLDQQEFELKQKESGEKTFNDFIENFSQDPTFKENLNQFYQTGEVNDRLAPLIEKGLAAGLSSIEQILAVAEYQTEQRRQFKQQMDLNWFNAQTSRYNATKKTEGGGSPVGKIPKELEQPLLQMLTSKGITKQRREDIIDLIATGGVEAAYTWVYNSMFTAAQKEEYDSYQKSIPVVRQSLGEINNDSSLSFSPYKSLLELSKPWIGLSRDPKYSKVRSQIEAAQAEIRRAYYGTAVTDSEKATADKFLINDNDDIATVKLKLENLANIAQFTNDIKRATPLGLEGTIKLSDYLTTEDLNIKPPETPVWGLNLNTDNENISDDQISNWWSNK